MILVKYSYDGMKSVINEDATRANLSALAAAKRKKGWEVNFYCGGYAFEAVHDEVAAGAVYRLRPDNWPRRSGEPD
jgi:hypothetical protein